MMMTNEEKPKNILIYTISSILTLLGLGIVVSKLTNKPKNLSNERIAIIGDSLAVGLSPKLSKIAKEQNIPFFSGGAGGSSIHQWSIGTSIKSWNLKEIVNSLNAFKPTIVLISLGTNDANGIDSFGSQVEKTIKTDIETLLKKVNASVIWIAPPNIKVFNSMPKIRQYIYDAGVPVFESDKFDIKLGSDGIHPTSEGYLTWANVIWKTLAS